MSGHAAAFFRVEKNLVPKRKMDLIQWLSINSYTLSHRMKGLGQSLLIRTLGHFTHGLWDPTRLSWMILEGMSKDRLLILGQEYAEKFLIPSLHPKTLALLESSRSRGLKIVLLSELLDLVVQPLAKTLDISLIMANRMEFQDGKATGTLLPPVFHGPVSAQQLQTFAHTHDLDLHRSQAYGALEEDSILLSLVGQPCAVDPEPALRQRANQLHWPIVER